MNKDSVVRRISVGETPLWSWLPSLLFPAALPAPLLGQAGGGADLAHDGRHLPGIPCH